MAQDFIHVRIDSAKKKEAEKTLNELGLNMTTGISLFINAIIRSKGLPFDLKLSRGGILDEKTSKMEAAFQKTVADAIAKDRADGYPIALYDSERACPYLEYPNGRKEYNEEPG